MNKLNLYISILCLIIIAKNVVPQLPDQAQVLSDSTCVQEPFLVNFATTIGAHIFSTTDSNTFLVYWLPSGAVPDSKPLIASLRGYLKLL